MPTQKLTLSVGDGDAGKRLDLFLAARLPEQCGLTLSRRRLRRLIERGAVYVDRKRTRIASRPLQAAAVVEVHVEGPEDRPRTGRRAPVPGLVRILYEDRDLIAVDKPAGMPTQATVDDAENHLLAHLERLLAARDGRKPYLALHHRLDRGTSGVVILARSKRVNAALAAAFRERQVVKTYRALCTGGAAAMPASGAFTVCNPLRRGRDPSTGRRLIVASSDGLQALSDVRFLEVRALPSPGLGAQILALVEARPHTGRTHQLRVHLADAGWPVIGDRLYGRKGGGYRGPMRLHASRLELDHPFGGRLVVESPPPFTLADG